MTYKPSESDLELKVEALVSQRLNEIFSNIKNISAMYVEPGDIVVVQVDEEADQETMSNIQRLMSHVFKQNQGVLTSDSIQFKVLKKGESNEQEKETVQSLKEKVYRLEKKLESLEDVFNDKRNA